MSQLEITYAPEKGRTYDFVILLSHSTNKLYLSQIYNDYDIILNEEIRSSHSRIFTAIQNENNDLLRLLFLCRDNGYSSFFSLFKNELMQSDNVEEFISKIYKYDVNFFHIKILSYLDIKNNLDDKFYHSLLLNNDMLFSYLDSMNLSDADKWTFTKFLDNPKIMIENLFSVLYLVKNELDIEYKILQDLREENYLKIKTLIGSSEYITDKLLEIIPMDRHKYEAIGFEKINISVITYLPYSSQAIWNHRALNLYLGFDFDKQIQKNNVNDNEITEDISAIFKAFSDETRNKIINIIKRKYNISFGDISKELNIPLSSLSHHIDIIFESGMINRINEGKKTLFSINNDGLDKAIKILTMKKI